MKKEVLIAIIVGFSFGLIITFGVRTARRSLAEHADQQNNPQYSPNAAASPTPKAHGLVVASPRDSDVISESEVTVSGTTSPDSLIAVLGGDEYQTTIADPQGNFSTNLPLSAGPNSLSIQSFSPDNQQSLVTLTIIYSSVIEPAPEANDE